MKSRFPGLSLLRSQFPEPFASPHTGYAEDDEGYAEQLSHVEHHALLEVDLVLFGELDEEAGSENQCEAEPEEET